MVRDPGRQARLHGPDAGLRPDGRAQPRDLPEGYSGGPVRRVAALRLDVAARPAADAARRHVSRDSARRAVQYRVQGPARAHPDEEHRVCRRARGAPRHGHRDHPGAPDREVFAQAGAHGLQPAGGRPRLQLRARALRLSAADQARGDGQDEGFHSDRRQHGVGTRVRLRRRDGRRLVSDHAGDVADGSVHQLSAASTAATRRRRRTSSRSCRPRTRSRPWVW